MKITRSREVYKCKVFRVVEQVASEPGGFRIERSIVQHAGSAVMMAVDDRERVLLVRQFRLPAAGFIWELPAGRLDKGETPLRAAKRELIEETGYRARKWKKLAEYWPSPGYVAEKMTLYLATGLTSGQATPMEDERIECRWFPRQELEKLVRAGKMKDGKTLIGFLMWNNARTTGA